MTIAARTILQSRDGGESVEVGGTDGDKYVIRPADFGANELVSPRELAERFETDAYDVDIVQFDEAEAWLRVKPTRYVDGSDAPVPPTPEEVFAANA